MSATTATLSAVVEARAAKQARMTIRIVAKCEWRRCKLPSE